jgi:hypothetical protein
MTGVDLAGIEGLIAEIMVLQRNIRRRYPDSRS